MISLQQTIRVLKVHSGYFKHVLSSLRPEDKEYNTFKQGAAALDTALYLLRFQVPKTPIYSPDIRSYKCSTCGCPVGFQVSPGVRCYACPKCTQRVDWIGIDK